MTIRSGLCAALAALATFALASVAHAAWNDDGQAQGNYAPDYRSDFRAEVSAIPSVACNTPEDDARPGEYYFRQGAWAFQHKDFAHAVKMYEVAASWAYKPAQFNLGVIYARGQGVKVDMPRAMAWMALAAERGDTQEYVDAKELVYGLLSKDQFAQANEIWRELRKTYGDNVALVRAKARWAEVRNAATGSHLGSTAAPMMVGNAPTKVAKLAPIGGGGAQHMATEAADFIGGYRADGSVVYKQLQESDNPYDPKFERPEVGTAEVGALQAVDGKEAPKADGTQH